MTNRAFFLLAVLALVLGGELGGILLVVLDDTDEGPTPIASIAGPGGAGDGPDFERLTELTGRVESGDFDPEDLEELAAQFPGAVPAGPRLVAPMAPA